MALIAVNPKGGTFRNHTASDSLATVGASGQVCPIAFVGVLEATDPPFVLGSAPRWRNRTGARPQNRPTRQLAPVWFWRNGAAGDLRGSLTNAAGGRGGPEDLADRVIRRIGISQTCSGDPQRIWSGDSWGPQRLTSSWREAFEALDRSGAAVQGFVQRLNTAWERRAAATGS